MMVMLTRRQVASSMLCVLGNVCLQGQHVNDHSNGFASSVDAADAADFCCTEYLKDIVTVCLLLLLHATLDLICTH